MVLFITQHYIVQVIKWGVNMKFIPNKETVELLKGACRDSLQETAEKIDEITKSEDLIPIKTKGLYNSIEVKKTTKDVVSIYTDKEYAPRVYEIGEKSFWWDKAVSENRELIDNTFIKNVKERLE